MDTATFETKEEPSHSSSSLSPLELEGGGKRICIQPEQEAVTSNFDEYANVDNDANESFDAQIDADFCDIVQDDGIINIVDEQFSELNGNDNDEEDRAENYREYLQWKDMYDQNAEPDEQDDEEQ